MLLSITMARSAPCFTRSIGALGSANSYFDLPLYKVVLLIASWRHTSAVFALLLTPDRG
jgi:hypothetical protein